ncbi:tol-pal system protein YbgF [Wenzhouxiangella sp. AB-CW3]|uniref:tol-pal system protein YbgF n=1 Tax=Wenzhouxiangella sp. AB-CW3 TaxID=2771012 RepID=UPI00168A985B|nr:tol-pal system protein YbgF [Wenzhouxiangella sp. AB-CW3]QOC23080.1 tol-pal system protein YbgF [Wenzhouxiangella sp. AB-CW3]
MKRNGLFRTLVVVGLLSTTPILVQAEDSMRLVYQMQDLLEEVRELRGMVEEQQREIENLRRRQRDQYLDLDERLQQLGRRPAATAGAAEEVEPIPPAPEQVPEHDPDDAPRVSDAPEVRAPIDAEMDVRPLASPQATGPRDLGTPTEDEQAAYDRAFRALRETRYADAAEGFSDFLASHPNSAYAPNALYWLAETYYVTRDFDTALSFFKQLLEQYPGSNKEGDALLKIGFSYYELREWSDARAALEQVRSDHPGTTLSRLAESRLRDMRLAGHY